MTNKLIDRYTQVGMETGVASADPHGLVLMLLEGAISSLVFARKEIDAGNISAKGEAISKAIRIISELDTSLNIEAGGEIAANLRTLYDYMGTSLLEANLKNDVRKLVEVVQLLSELKTAWLGIADEVRPKKHLVREKTSKEIASYGLA